jgi:hypothetical protein
MAESNTFVGNGPEFDKVFDNRPKSDILEQVLARTHAQLRRSDIFIAAAPQLSAKVP